MISLINYHNDYSSYNVNSMTNHYLKVEELILMEPKLMEAKATGTFFQVILMIIF